MIKSSEVFGISTRILEPSYVDRGDLDRRIQQLLERNTHIALRGESKCGKSWLRQKNIPDGIVVQCRLNKSVTDLFADAFSQLGLNLVENVSSKSTNRFSLSASTQVGIDILSHLKSVLGIKIEREQSVTSIPIGQNLTNLSFVAKVLQASGKRLVIEDFHYLPINERRAFAADMKALWDYEVYVVVIGIWNENNLLLHLNPDLSGRVEELSIYWSEDELRNVIKFGAAHLNLEFGDELIQRIIDDSYNTVGILQKLVIGSLDEANILKKKPSIFFFNNIAAYESAVLKYADQLNALYQTFAARVANGVRQRKNSTGIYAHMLKVTLEANDEQLRKGLHINEIFEITTAAEPRIKKANLRTILRQIDNLQVDQEGRGLILSYDESKDEVTAVDRQLFLYRKYSTVKWPWENLISENSDDSFEGDAQS